MLIFTIVAGIAAGAAALLYALYRYTWIRKKPIVDEKLQQITGFIRSGSMTFLKKEYQSLLPFILVVAGYLYLGNEGSLKLQSAAFLAGATTSALAGFLGMRVATMTNGRTTQAALEGMKNALAVSFAGGSVIGMCVVGLVLIGVTLTLWLAATIVGTGEFAISSTVLPILSGFSLGASSIALFARLGGGIFTKAADVGADLVGKIEAGIPEDDPRNPATIADNVGDNVGDVAGMGADLFESFVGSLLGAMILAFAVTGTLELKLRLMALPILLAVIGAGASILGALLVKSGGRKSPQRALNIGSFGAALISAVVAIPVLYFLLRGIVLPDSMTMTGIYFAVITGVVTGIGIGLVTELFTGTGTRPVNSIVKAAITGPATTLITGMGMGMLSTLLPVILIAAAIWIGSALAGMYGVAVAAVGMLMTLGIQLAVDAYGPIADNAGGLAVMCEFPSEVRDVTDELDAVGNTTAAVGKGFAIGSAALTGIILLNSFTATLGIDSIDLTSAPVLIGIFVGSMLPYVFSALAMNSIGKAAFEMIEEVRRQFRETPEILTGDILPDYDRCIAISTESALEQMRLPGLIALAAPVAVGFFGGPSMLVGLLVGVTASGVVLAIFLSNSGGAWDNAKKMIESGEGGGRGSEAHKAAVVGDTVGDPFKDTAGPSLNILIKLMSVVSLVIAPMLTKGV